jgi:hypothetical protein
LFFVVMTGETEYMPLFEKSGPKTFHKSLAGSALLLFITAYAVQGETSQSLL